MKAKLIKLFNGYILNVDNLTIASTVRDAYGSIPHNLCEENCNSLFEQRHVWTSGLKDELDKLPYTKHLDDGQYNDGQIVGFELGAEWGFNKAMELNKDKVFTLEDMNRAMEVTLNYELKRDAQSYQEKIDFLKSLQQPTEIDVEIVMEWKPKSSHCSACGEGGRYMENPCDHSSDCEHWQPKLDDNGKLMIKKI